MAPEWRPNLYVVARFLDALYDGARTKSDLQASAGVNYDIFRRYVAFLEARGFVTHRTDGSVALTPAGARVRAELRAWLERFLAGAPPPEPAGAPSLHGSGAPDAER